MLAFSPKEKWGVQNIKPGIKLHLTQVLFAYFFSERKVGCAKY